MEANALRKCKRGLECMIREGRGLSVCISHLDRTIDAMLVDVGTKRGDRAWQSKGFALALLSSPDRAGPSRGRSRSAHGQRARARGPIEPRFDRPATRWTLASR